MKTTVAALAFLLALPVQAAEPMDWGSVVDALATERTRASTCLSLFKQLTADDLQARLRGELAYGEAKASMDGAIARLSVGAIQGTDDVEGAALLQNRLETAIAGRQTFCADVDAMLEEDQGTRSLLADMIGPAVEGLIGGAVDLYLGLREEEMLIRQTIQSQIEAQRWPDFNPPS